MCLSSEASLTRRAFFMVAGIAAAGIITVSRILRSAQVGRNRGAGTATEANRERAAASGDVTGDEPATLQVRCGCGQWIAVSDMLTRTFYRRYFGPSFTHVCYRCPRCDQTGEAFVEKEPREDLRADEDGIA